MIRPARPAATNALRPAVATVLGFGVLFVALAVWETMAPFVPHAFPGVSFTSSPGFGRINTVYPEELPRGVHIAIGDLILERPNGDVLRGYRLRVPELGDEIHVSTSSGIVTLRASAEFYPKRDAIGQALRAATGALTLLCATVLFARRPGWMSFAFWLWGLSGIGGPDLDFAVDWLPRPVGLGVDLLFLGLTYSGLALISFALRFPGGSVSPRLRWLDVAVWTVLCASFIYEVIERALYLAGAAVARATDLRTAALTMLVAAGILLWRQAHSEPFERSKIVWASTAFAAAAVARAGGYALAVGDDPLNNFRLLMALANLLPLLAIYPILRHRLFDLGFVVSRAALYSVLTLAAFGTLAAVNWLAQHFVTERLAFIMQPVAAIAIGLGYFRVRGWVQGVIERVLFRERFAAEEALEATIRGLPFVERAQSVDAVLVTEVPRMLRLSSAALFGLTDHGFERGTSVGWNGELLARFSRDDMLVRSVLADGPIVRLSSLRWEPERLPSPPNDPVVALGIARRGVLSAIVLYGRHDNGTELEPDELRLMRRVGEAAAVAYETAEVATLREHVKVIEARLRKFESEGAPA